MVYVHTDVHFTIHFMCTHVLKIWPNVKCLHYQHIYIRITFLVWDIFAFSIFWYYIVYVFRYSESGRILGLYVLGFNK